MFAGPISKLVVISASENRIFSEIDRFKNIFATTKVLDGKSVA